jgi:hypothetical protein
MWAAADLAVRRRRKRADEFAARVCQFAGLDDLDEGAAQFAEDAARAARVGLTRRA